MKNQRKTRQQLIAENEDLRRRLDALINNLPEQRVKQRTAELTKANERLRRLAEERRRAEEETRRAQHLWERTFDSVPDLIMLVDDRYRVVRVNQAMAERCGRTPEDCVGLTCHEIVHGLSKPPSFCPHALTLADGKGHAADVHEGRLGGDFLVTTTPLSDQKGQFHGSVHVAHDITDRKRAEVALRQSERRFRDYFQQGLIGMAVTSVDRRWLEVNDRLCQMMDLSREELLQTNWVKLTHPDDREPNLQLFNRLVAGEIEHFTLEKRFLRKDGSIVYATIHVRAVCKEDGSIDHVVALIEDITARKRVQEALARERQSLWRMLQASDHERQIISYEIHDGLAQYLAAATMQFQVFDELRNSSPEEAKKAYDAAAQLVSQSHSEARRLISEVRPPVIDENGIEMAISHLVHEQRRHGGPKIECHSSVQFGRLPAILENALYRIAQEALNNACKHSQSKKVTVTLAQEGQDVRLEVRDWGIGFEPASVEKGHFGLEGIRQRVRLLGGRLKIESAPGTGSLVQVVAPLLEEQIDG